MPLPCHPCPGYAAHWRVDTVRAPFAYGPPLARYIQVLKYGRQRRLARALGHLLAACLDPADVDVLVPVPLHPHRLRARTFNQSDEIAMTIAACFGRPLLTSGIRRVLETRAQSELDRIERTQLAPDTFSVVRNLEGLRIAIVDDVITTGATINALCAALNGAGAVRVEAWAVARSIGSVGGPA